MMAVDRKVDLKQLFTSVKVDIFSRFASFYHNESYERLHKYFDNRVEYNYDPVSSVATLKVKAFSGESARDINLALLENSEALVNKLARKSWKRPMPHLTNTVMAITPMTKTLSRTTSSSTSCVTRQKKSLPLL